MSRVMAFCVLAVVAAVGWPVARVMAQVVPSGQPTAMATELENIVQFKFQSTGTALTTVQQAALPAELGSGSTALATVERAAGIVSFGRLGWLPLALGAIMQVQSLVSGVPVSDIVADKQMQLYCSATSSCTVNVAEDVPTTNIVAGQGDFCAQVSTEVGSAKLCGVSADAAAAEASAWQNSNSVKFAFGQPTRNGNGTWTETQVNKPGQAAFSSNYGFTTSGNTAPTSHPSPFSGPSDSAAVGREVMPVPPSQSVQGLQDAIPSVEAGKLVSPQVIAGLAQGVMQQAQSQPGYAGPTIPASSPITAADVANYHAANPSAAWPTVDQSIASAVTVPVSASTAPTLVAPFPAPTTPANLGPSQAPQSQSSPPCGNAGAGEPSCEVDFGQAGGVGAGTPVDPTVPGISAVLDPLWGMVSPLTSWTVPAHTGSCPVGQFQMWGKTFSFGAACTLAETIRPTLGAAFMVVFAVQALFVLLAA